MVLFTTFCVYIYRDVFPLATFTRHPEDLSEGWLLWFQIAVLGVSSVIIPLVVPRKYIPVDPKVCHT